MTVLLQHVIDLLCCGPHKGTVSLCYEHHWGLPPVIHGKLLNDTFPLELETLGSQLR